MASLALRLIGDAVTQGCPPAKSVSASHRFPDTSVNAGPPALMRTTGAARALKVAGVMVTAVAMLAVPSNTLVATTRMADDGTVAGAVKRPEASMLPLPAGRTDQFTGPDAVNCSVFPAATVVAGDDTVNGRISIALTAGGSPATAL